MKKLLIGIIIGFIVCWFVNGSFDVGFKIQSHNNKEANAISEIFK